MKYLLVVGLIFGSLQLAPSPAATLPRDQGYSQYLPFDLESHEIWLGSPVVKEPFGNRLVAQGGLIDPNTGEITHIPFSGSAATISGSKLVACIYAKYFIFDLQNDVMDAEGEIEGLSSRWPERCDLRNGLVFNGDPEGLRVINPVDNSSYVVSYPGHSKLLIVAGAGVEADMLHVRSGDTYHDISLDDLTQIGQARTRRQVVHRTTGTYVKVADEVLAEYNAEGELLRSMPCELCRDSDRVFPVDEDRVIVSNDLIRVMNLDTQSIEATVYGGSNRKAVAIDDQYLYLGKTTELFLLPRDDVFITGAPETVDLRTDTNAVFKVWALSEPTTVMANGQSVPFERTPDGAIDVDLSSLSSGPVSLTATFASGSTTDPVTFDLITVPTFKEISVTAYDYEGESNTARVSMRCTGPHAQSEEQYVSSGQSAIFSVPEGAPCEAFATGGRFGPMLEGQFVIDYSATWPDFKLDPADPGDEWALWVGEDVAHPVYWLIVDKTAGAATTRPAELYCDFGLEIARGEVEYGSIYRVVRDSVPALGSANFCDWNLSDEPNYDGTKVEVYGPVTESEAQGILHYGDPSSLTIVTDYLNHPDNDSASFVNAIMRRANGRPASPAELNYWQPLLDASPVRRGQLVDALVRGEEYQRQAEPVARLYQAYFDRLPDADGLAYWTEIVSAGTTLLEVSDYFAQSEEFLLKYGQANNRQFVELAYQNVLGRDPDNEGYEYWLGTMDDQGLSGPGVLLYFSDSAEFRHLMRERLAVSGTYNIVVGRTPTNAEMQAGIASFRSTGSVLELANSLIGTADYDASFARYERHSAVSHNSLSPFGNLEFGPTHSRGELHSQR